MLEKLGRPLSLPRDAAAHCYAVPAPGPAAEKRTINKKPCMANHAGFLIWWWYRDLNLGHQHYECCALTN